MNQRQHHGPDLAVLALMLVGGFFIYLTAYCVAGWWGVAGWSAFAGMVWLIIRSEIAASGRRQQRADAEWIRYHAHYTDAQTKARRARRTRGGAR